MMNVRFVNATFEDRRQPAFDADANTAAFLKVLPEYVACGVRGITLCLQGGHVGYEGPLNSAFEPDGTLRADYLERVGKVIEACDRQGVAVILGCYYQRQDQVLRDEAAVKAGVVNACRWITDRGFTNVVLEVANEFPHKGFDHQFLRSPQGEVELIRLARQAAPGVLVSSSGYGDARISDDVAREADFLLIHFNGTPVDQIGPRVRALQRFGKPIVCNEDDKTGADAVRAVETSVAQGVSWGYMNNEVNQYVPLEFKGVQDDPVMYAALKRLTSPVPPTSATPNRSDKAPSTGDDDSAGYFPPPDANGGWRTVDSADVARRVVRIDPQRLDRAFEYIQGSTQHGGLLIVKDGWLVYERYFGLGDRKATPNLASCGKSITSIAVGILLDEYPQRFPDGLAQRVYTPDFLPAEAFPVADARKEWIELGHLLTMTAGIRGNNPSFVHGKGVEIDPRGPDGSTAMVDAIAFGQREEPYQGNPATTRTLWCDPGGGYSYATSSIHIASAIVRQVSGMELEEYVRTRLAEPLGWGTWSYGYQTNHELTHTPGGGGLCLRSTDMLRFGWLLLNEGRWGDRQVVSPEYVRHCRSSSPFNPHFPYSLQFNVNTNGEVPELPRDAVWKSGSGGHVLYVVPSQQLVIWKLGGRTGQYSPADTGLTRSPAPPEQVARRDGWQANIDQESAVTGTLKLVLDAMEGPGQR